ncbi:MAG TPA: hypothetical protein VMF90_15810 [Rhizobiaceae bacterium]|nr:hypothetical protein [Rhizobiaceae bacterium]
MRNFDFSSWQAILTSIGGLLLITMIGMGIRLLMMMTIQQRRERQNRQINERLRALIAAYKTLGGSFTGNLRVDPTHMRDLRRAQIATPAAPESAPPSTPPAAPLSEAPAETAPVASDDGEEMPPRERARRIRDAVEAALSDIVLFGTDSQVELAAAAMREMAAGRPVHVHELVVSLRAYIREALDLDPIPASVVIPNQGPARPSSSGGRGGGGRGEGGGSGGGGRGGGGMGGGMAMGGMGLGLGAGLGVAAETEETGKS